MKTVTANLIVTEEIVVSVEVDDNATQEEIESALYSAPRSHGDISSNLYDIEVEGEEVGNPDCPSLLVDTPMFKFSVDVYVRGESKRSAMTHLSCELDYLCGLDNQVCSIGYGPAEDGVQCE